MKNLVLTKNILPHNLVLKNEENKFVIKIVDGLGCHTFVPLPQNFRLFAKIYVKKRVNLMWQRINWELLGKKGDWKKFYS